jgi:hypothetical protein
MQPEGHVVTWEEFRTAFRAYHIPEGLIEWKLNEFLALTQGTRTVMQYAQAFNHLCQYTGYCGRTNRNYTGSSMRVHSRGLQHTSNGIIPWPVG